MLGKEVVEIPGFSTFYGFSNTFRAEFTHALSNWQLRDGFIKQSWIIDLMGTETTTKDDLSDRMDRIYREYHNENFIPFIRLKLGRSDSHALLVISIEGLATGRGYQMKVIDSNYPEESMLITYHYGDTFLSAPKEGMERFVPEVAYGNYIVKIQSAINQYCKSEGFSRF